MLVRINQFHAKPTLPSNNDSAVASHAFHHTNAISDKA